MQWSQNCSVTGNGEVARSALFAELLPLWYPFSVTDVRANSFLPSAQPRDWIQHPLVQGAAALAGITGAALAYYAVQVEPFRLRCRTETIWLADLAPSLDKLTILHLSDFHADTRNARLMALLHDAVDEPADIAVVTGDFVRSPADIAAVSQILNRIQAPLGVFAVLGNHDHQDRQRPRPALARAIRRMLDQSGVVEVANRGVRFERDGGALWLAGVDDPHTRHDNLPQALAQKPAGLPIILLSHSPDIVPKACKAGIALVLSGHTHGGQVRLPFVGTPVTHTRVHHPKAAGLWRAGDTWVNVSNGLGFFVQLRFQSPPEVVRLTLRRGHGIAP